MGIICCIMLLLCHIYFLRDFFPEMPQQSVNNLKRRRVYDFMIVLICDSNMNRLNSAACNLNRVLSVLLLLLEYYLSLNMTKKQGELSFRKALKIILLIKVLLVSFIKVVFTLCICLYSPCDFIIC